LGTLSNYHQFIMFSQTIKHCQCFYNDKNTLDKRKNNNSTKKLKLKKKRKEKEIYKIQGWPNLKIKTKKEIKNLVFYF
jgi:hypothetical protein